MKIKKRVTIIVIFCLVILICGFLIDTILGKSYLVEIKYDKLLEKLDNKQSFVILMSQTTCNHCMNYKPKLKKVANEYKLEIYYIDIDLLSKDKRDNLGDVFGFDSTPVTIFIKNGEESSKATRIEGDTTIEKIKIKLKSNGFIN